METSAGRHCHTILDPHTYQRGHDDVLGGGSSVPLEAVIFPLPLEKVGVCNAQAERVLVIDRNDVRERPRGAIRAINLVPPSIGREGQRKMMGTCNGEAGRESETGG